MSSADNMAAPFFLQPHVFACVTPSGGVFLDAQRYKYFAVSAAKIRALSAALQGYPLLTAAEPYPDIEEVTRLGMELIDAGLLTRNAAHGKPMTPVVMEPAETQVEWEPDRPRVSVAHARTFFSCAGLTAAALRYRSRPEVIRSLQVRKERCAHQRGNDPDAIRELARVFRAIRPFGYTLKDRCLFDSLVLLRFLLSFGYRATLVFGVRAQPFFAHSWVQAGRCVLNCPADYTRSFTPIRVL